MSISHLLTSQSDYEKPWSSLRFEDCELDGDIILNNAPMQDNAATELLARDTVTGVVKQIATSAIGGGGGPTAYASFYGDIGANTGGSTTSLPVPGTFYPIDVSTLGLVQGSAVNFTLSNLASAGPTFTYTGAPNISCIVTVGTRCQSTAATIMWIGLEYNGTIIPESISAFNTNGTATASLNQTILVFPVAMSTGDTLEIVATNPAAVINFIAMGMSAKISSM